MEITSRWHWLLMFPAYFELQATLKRPLNRTNILQACQNKPRQGQAAGLCQACENVESIILLIGLSAVQRQTMSVAGVHKGYR